MSAEKARTLDFGDAEQALTGGQLDRALSLFSAFVKNHPDSSLITDSYYRIAQIHAKQNRFPLAITAYQKVLENQNSGDLANLAKFQLGFCYQKLNLPGEASDFFLSADVSKFSRDVQYFIVRTLVENSGRVVDAEKQLAMLDRSLLIIGSAEWARQKPDQTVPINRHTIEESARQLISNAFDMDGLLKASTSSNSPYVTTLLRLRIGLLYSHQKNYSQAEEVLRPLVDRLEKDSESIPAFARPKLARLQKQFHADPHSIGVLLPLSGPFSQWGQSVLNGILFSINELIPKPGAPDSMPHRKSRFVLHIRDTGASSPSLSDVVDGLVYDDNVSLIIGPLQADQTALVTRKTESLGIPVISFSPKEGISQLGQSVFQIALTTRTEVDDILKFLTENLKARSAAVLFPDNNYGHQFARHFWAESKRRGVAVAAIESYPPGSKDFVVPLKKMVGLFYLDERRDEICPKAATPRGQKGSRPSEQKIPCYPENELPPIIDFDVLVVPDSFETISLLVPHLAYLNMNGIQLVGTSVWDLEKVMERAGSYLNGAIVTDTFNRFSPKYFVRNFYRSFQAHFSEPPDRFAADGFDAMELVKMVFESHEVHERSDIAKAFREIADFPAVSGTIRATADGSWRKKPSFFIVDELTAKLID